jgi:glycosyltransferase involved in cell wall biosynthesis
MFRLPHAFGFLTPEEEALVARRFRVRRPSVTTGVGVELDIAVPDAAVAAFRAAHGLGDDPYLVFVGRLDPHKGTDELFDFFTTYKAANPGPLKLVLVGQPIQPVGPHPDVVVTGWVSDGMRDAALAGSFALVHPSYFESFSLMLVEAWVYRKPALVQGHCDVLAGQARRSGGGLPYRGYREFEAALDLLLTDDAVVTRLGSAGRAYVEANYRWDDVLTRYERFLAATAR